MQFEMANLSCPLCKRQVPANSPEHTPGTRLCVQCQTMVLTALRRPGSIAFRAPAVVPRMGGSDPDQRESTGLNLIMATSPALLEASPGYAPVFEDQQQSSIPFDMSVSGFDFYKDEDPVHRLPKEDSERHAFSDNGTTPHYEESTEPFQPYNVVSGDDSADPGESDLTDQAFEPAILEEKPVQAAPSVVDARSESSALISEERVTDPWESPLPAWDYSHNEWPVLVEPTRRRSFKALRYGIAAVVVLVCAAGVYLMMYRTATSHPRSTTDSGASARVAAVVPDPAGTPGVDAVARTLVNQSEARPGGSTQPPETPGREAVATDDNSARGRFSLQAAAFPTAGGADEMAEKLKQAGLPSYVVPADIAHRGRWFRVRVGRFNSAEDAQRFAGEAQQRARAHGFAVQLMVCQYDQP